MSEVYITTLSNQFIVRNQLHTQLRNMTDEELCHFVETSSGWGLVGATRWLALELARRLEEAQVGKGDFEDGRRQGYDEALSEFAGDSAEIEELGERIEDLEAKLRSANNTINAIKAVLHD